MKFEVQVGDQNFQIEIEKGKDNFLVKVGGSNHRVDLVKDPSGILSSFIIDGRHYEALCRDQGDVISVEFEERCYDVIVGRGEAGKGAPVRLHGASGRQIISAPMPGLINAVKVAVGDTVKPGEALLILEAMKMQNELRCPVAGRVLEVLVDPGKAVEKGERLIALEAQ